MIEENPSSLRTNGCSGGKGAEVMSTSEHAFTIKETTIDLDVLPDEAQRELIVFYQFLVFKYQRQGMPHKDMTLSSEQPSKWAKITQRVHEDPAHLGGYAKALQQDMQEFRNHFEFLHDQKQSDQF